MRFLWILLLLGGMGNVANGQGISLDRWTGFEHEDQVVLNWTLSAGSLCNGIDVYRSTDGIQFEKIGGISGVCGGIDEPQTFDFIDPKPIANHINYYYLELGTGEKSAVIGIEVVQLPKYGYQIRPNPVHDQGKIYFENSTHSRFTFTLTNPWGMAVEVLITNEFYFELDVTKLPPGIYFFVITDQDGATQSKGRLVVAY
jgi:hypothetical protein